MTTRPRLVWFVHESGQFLCDRLHIAVAAQRAGFDVHIVTRAPQDSKVDLPHGLTIHPVRLPRRVGSPLAKWRAVGNLVRVYREVKPNVVHHWTTPCVLLGSIAARRLNLRSVVNTFTDLESALTGRTLRLWAKRVTAERALRRALCHPGWRTTFQDPADVRRFTQAKVVPFDRCQIVRGLGVDPHEFRPTPEPAGIPHVICAARMVWTDGLQEFVDAARQLRDRGIQARWILVGSPDRRTRGYVPRAQVRQWEEEKVLQFWGQCGNMPYVLSQASIVVLPGYDGGIRRILLEAASCGKPIVASNVRGFREIVRDGENGILVPPRDSTALAEAIARLLDEPWEGRNMGARGRQIVLDEFTATRVSQAMLDVYRHMLNRAAAPSRRAA